MALPNSPLTRGEQYLSAIAGQDTALPNVPLTRIEQYLAKIAGQDVAVPNVPLTRVEQYLAAIAENGGGGNPNTQQTITGTVANPWGNVNYDKLAAALYSEDAHATIAFEFNGTYAKVLLTSTGSNVYGSAATMGGDVASSLSVVLTWSTTGEIFFAKVIMGGQLQDLISYTPGLSSSLNIYWHPMP